MNLTVSVSNREEVMEDLKKWAANLIFKAGVELYRGVTERTPVDSGAAKANWNCSVGSPDLSFNEFASFDSDRAARAFVNVKAGDNLFITNSAPYILELEDGSSSQAPNGMAGVTVLDCARKIESGEIK